MLKSNKEKDKTIVTKSTNNKPKDKILSKIQI